MSFPFAISFLPNTTGRTPSVSEKQKRPDRTSYRQSLTFARRRTGPGPSCTVRHRGSSVGSKPTFATIFFSHTDAEPIRGFFGPQPFHVEAKTPKQSPPTQPRNTREPQHPKRAPQPGTFQATEKPHRPAGKAHPVCMTRHPAIAFRNNAAPATERSAIVRPSLRTERSASARLRQFPNDSNVSKPIIA